MTREEAITVLEKEATIIDDNSIEMTAREWAEFDDLKRDAIPVAIQALSDDTEQVVRCKYCKYYEGNDVGWCPKLEKGIFDSFFCALGEEDKHE